MNLSKTHNVYFIGIGGIGMSAIARYFAANGKNVAGYDKTKTPLTDSLMVSGIEVHYEDAVKNIPISFLDATRTMVIFTPAVPKDHSELNYFIDNGYTVLKRSEILGAITKDTFCLAVAGTHGKTTTSSILGHIMQPEGATAFLGGIAENYHSNLILGEDKISVVEADEFDRSFLRLAPNVACITSMDADHLDIYGEADALHQSFREFASKVTDMLLVAEGLPLEGLKYGFSENADYRAFNIQIKNGAYIFSVKTPTKVVNELTFYLPGKHNLMNALAALAIADVYGVSLEVIKEQLKTFAGVERRFSYKIKAEEVVLIDDYAHHPTEIAAVEDSVREMYPNKKVVAVFQPHLFSRTKDFADDFAKALSKFDEVLLLDIYPAREKPVKGITSAWLLEKIDNSNKKLTTKENVGTDVLKSNATIVVMIGAGDIGLLVNDVKVKLEEKYNL